MFTSLRHSWLTLIIFSLFLGCLIGAYGWFNWGQPEDMASHWIEVHSHMAGYTFKPEPIDEQVRSVLNTTNVINGTFIPNSILELQDRSSKNRSGKSKSQEVLDEKLMSEAGDRRSGSLTYNSPLAFTLPPVRVFLATWHAETGHGLNLVQHTPDICWVWGGWKPVELGQPFEVLLQIPWAVAGSTNLSTSRAYSSTWSSPTTNPIGQPSFSTTSPSSRGPSPRREPGTRAQEADPYSKSLVELPFECRVFRSPQGNAKELVVWCTLLGGQILSEQRQFRMGSDELTQNYADDRSRGLAVARRATARHLWQAIIKRLPTGKTKQFVRISLPLDNNWSNTVTQIQAFAVNWINIVQLNQQRNQQSKPETARLPN